jgi:hypothetical protein
VRGNTKELTLNFARRWYNSGAHNEAHSNVTEAGYMLKSYTKLVKMDHGIISKTIPHNIVGSSTANTGG